MTIQNQQVRVFSSKDYSAENVTCLATSLNIWAGTVYLASFAYILARFEAESPLVLDTIIEQSEKKTKCRPIKLDCRISDRELFLKNADYAIKRPIMSEDAVPPLATVFIQQSQHVDKNCLLNIHCKIVLSVNLSDNKVSFCLCSPDIYEDSWSEKLLDSLCRFLDGLSSEKRLDRIQYISETDLTYYKELNSNEVPRRWKNVVDALEAGFTRWAERTALSFDGETRDYRYVKETTDSIAHALIQTNVRRGSPVAILVPRGECYPLCSIAVLKTGSAYVPLDPSIPDERLSFILSDCNAGILLTTENMRKRAESLCSGTDSCSVFNLSKALSHPFEPVPVEPEDPAMILYTSGTTGKPKGVCINHRALNNLAEWYCSRFDLNKGDVVSMCAAFSFDMHAMAMYPPLLCGAILDIVDDVTRLDLTELDCHFEQYGTTHAFITTSLMKKYLSIMKHPPKILFTAGEKLGHVKTPSGSTLIDGYGPTENFAISTFTEVDRKCDPSSVGWPIDNVRCAILDWEHRPVPRCAIGELYLGGKQLMSGYVAKEDPRISIRLLAELTGEALFYPTGDYFKILPDGSLGIIGRKDSQVKIAGNRIELTEIENTLSEIDGIAETVVLTVDRIQGVNLRAYILSNMDLSEESIRERVSSKLPYYMIPSEFVFVDMIPHNVNGKVDKKRLLEETIKLDDGIRAMDDIDEVFLNLIGSIPKKECDLRSLVPDSIHIVELLYNLQKKGYDIGFADVLNLKTVGELKNRLQKTSLVRPSTYQFPLSNGDTVSFNSIDISHYEMEYGLFCERLKYLQTRGDICLLRYCINDCKEPEMLIRTWIKSIPSLRSTYSPKTERIHVSDSANGFYQICAVSEEAIQQIRKDMSNIYLHCDTGAYPLAFTLAQPVEDRLEIVLLIHHLLYDDFSDIPLLKSLELSSRKNRIVQRSFWEYLQSETSILIPCIKEDDKLILDQCREIYDNNNKQFYQYEIELSDIEPEYYVIFVIDMFNEILEEEYGRPNLPYRFSYHGRNSSNSDIVGNLVTDLMAKGGQELNDIISRNQVAGHSAISQSIRSSEVYKRIPLLHIAAPTSFHKVLERSHTMRTLGISTNNTLKLSTVVRGAVGIRINSSLAMNRIQDILSNKCTKYNRSKSQKDY